MKNEYDSRDPLAFGKVLERVSEKPKSRLGGKTDAFLNRHLTLRKWLAIAACGLAFDSLAVLNLINKVAGQEYPPETRAAVQAEMPLSQPYQSGNAPQSRSRPKPNYSPKNKDYKADDNFSTDSDEELLARMLFGEARNCSDLEKQIAIGYTAVNRANDGKKWNGKTIKGVILCPRQYSCFNPKDSNLPKLKDPMKHNPEAFGKCLEIAQGVLGGKYENIGATHYHTKQVNPRWNNSPDMTKIFVADDPYHEFKHLFYREN